MGTNIEVLTVYGIRIDWNADFYSEFSKVDDADQIESVIDNMCGEYMIFGKILYSSGDFRYMENMNDFQELDILDMEKYKPEYIKKFKDLYPEHIHLIQDREWKLMNLIYYS